MITNKTITYYHKKINTATRLEEWERTIFTNAWVFETKGSNVSQGYENANNVVVRIPIKFVKDKTIFNIGDIVAIGKQKDIIKQSDLKDVSFFNITSININEYGNNPHVHLGGN